MDKIRKEFESIFNITDGYIYDENTYTNKYHAYIWDGFQEGRKSRDKEINILKLQGENDIITIGGLKDRIKSLRKSLEPYCYGGEGYDDSDGGRRW